MKIAMVVASLCTVFLMNHVAFAAGDRGYSCSMRVDNPTSEEKVTKGDAHKSKSGRTTKSVKTKTKSRSVSWSVSGSVRGDSVPPSDSIKLKCYFIGTTDGKPALLGEKTMAVALDDKGRFNIEVESPVEKLVQTTTTTKQRRGSRRSGRGGSANTRSETTGSRVTGCIIQLVVKGNVEKSYASHPGWSKFAKTSPVPMEEVLKIR